MIIATESPVVATDPSSAKAIGRRIADRRHALGMTQEELGEKVGHHKQSISDWERGVRTPYIESLAKLADALVTTLDVLVYGEDPTSRPARPFDPAAKEQIVTYLRLAEQLLRDAPPRVRDRVSGALEGIEMVIHPEANGD